MTTKKYKDSFQKLTKNLTNIMIEEMFSDFVLYKNGKRIGALFDNQVLLIETENLLKLLPNAVRELSFDWGYYKLLKIDFADDAQLLESAINVVYNDLYFFKDYVTDISELLESYRQYSDTITKIYNYHITFLAFSFENNLLKNKALDKSNRIIKMRFVNNDLTELGCKIFAKLYRKWLIYNDKNDEKSENRSVNTKMLEKYFQSLLQEVKI